jgi:hypothetical protein
MQSCNVPRGRNNKDLHDPNLRLGQAFQNRCRVILRVGDANRNLASGSLWTGDGLHHHRHHHHV